MLTAAVDAGIRVVHGREVAWFELAGGRRHGAIGPDEGRVVAALVDRAVDVGVPVVGVVDTNGADVTHGVATLHAWGRVAASLSRASGVVPIVLCVTGSAVSGPALLLGLADVVVMGPGASAYVSSPAAVALITGTRVDGAGLGAGARTTLASMVDDDVVAAAMHVLSYLPDNNMAEAPAWPTSDPLDRPCTAAAAAVPAAASASYDMRAVVADVVDDGELLEVRPHFAPNLVTAFAAIGGRAVGVVANQPSRVGGTLDIEASQKGARFVQLCDAFNLPLVTFVDTPGFLPGKDLEWRGMIRHGAQLVHAYGAATVPRVCVIVRKAYGGAYIVMDSKGLGSDHCLAWPTAEAAVMGAAGAVQVLHGRKGLSDGERSRLEAEYAAKHCTPEIALRRGFVDEVIAPESTRAAVAAALHALRNKRERLPRRRHANGPL